MTLSLDAYRAVTPLYDEAIKHVDPSTAARLTAYAVSYRWLRDQDGRRPTIERLSEAMLVSPATVKRYQARFREVFAVDSPLDLTGDLSVPAIPTLPVAMTALAT